MTPDLAIHYPIPWRVICLSICFWEVRVSKGSKSCSIVEQKVTCGLQSRAHCHPTKTTVVLVVVTTRCRPARSSGLQVPIEWLTQWLFPCRYEELLVCLSLLHAFGHAAVVRDPLSCSRCVSLFTDQPAPVLAETPLFSENVDFWHQKNVQFRLAIKCVRWNVRTFSRNYCTKHKIDNKILYNVQKVCYFHSKTVQCTTQIVHCTNK